MNRRELAAASDEQLARWAGAGDEDAFAVLVSRYRCRLVRYAGRLSAGTGVDPEDVVQDCLLAALRALRGGTRPDNFGAWVHVIARNACVDAAQHRPAAAAAQVGTGPGASESAHDAVVRRERFRAIIGDIAALSPTQRRAVLAREFEGRSYQQLADDHGTTVAAVKSLLFRARAVLHARTEGRDFAIMLPAAIWARLSPLRKAAAAAAVPAQKGVLVGACAVLGVGGAVSAPALPRLSVQVTPAYPPAHLIENAISASRPIERESGHRGAPEPAARVARVRRDCSAEPADAVVYEYALRPEEYDCSD